MYAPANQPPDFHYYVNDSHQKLTVLVGLCENDMLDPFFFDKNVNIQSYLNLLNKWWGYTFDGSVVLKSISWKSISTFVVGPETFIW